MATTSSHFVDYCKQANNGKGQTLFNHLCEVIEASVQPTNPVKGLDRLEVLSNHLKNAHFKFKQAPVDTELNSRTTKPGELNAYIKDSTALLEKAESICPKNVVMPNIWADFEALKTAGVSIGELNTQLISKCLKVLAQKHDARQLRFWGKVLGFKDYWVIQGLANRKNNDQLGKEYQALGTGVNHYSYWVTTGLLEDWIELPLIGPEHIRAAKEVKYIFTGDLNRQIHQYPTFSGKQKHLLKAQIVRITHSCELVPSGLYKFNEETQNIEFEDEFKQPQVLEMNSAQAWVHLNPYVLHQGRCSYYIDPTLNQDQRAALDTENSQKDPTVGRLKPIAEDKPLEKLGYSTNWSLQQMGESQVVGKDGPGVVYGVVLLKNLTWPGAATVGYSGGWTNLYVGYAQKVVQNSFNPIQPKDIGVEGEDKNEYREPNPAQAPPPPQADAPKPDDPPADD